MKKAAVLIENHYEDLEAWYPYLRLRESGIETVFVGTGSQEYTGKNGYPAKEQANIKQVNPEEYDAVIVPGGYAPDILRRYSEVNEFVKEMFESNKLVAAICHAGSVLVSADILNGKTVTCFYAIKDDIVNAGAEFVDKEVVVDGNLITSRNPYDLPVFCREIVKFLKEN